MVSTGCLTGGNGKLLLKKPQAQDWSDVCDEKQLRERQWRAHYNHLERTCGC